MVTASPISDGTDCRGDAEWPWAAAATPMAPARNKVAAIIRRRRVRTVMPEISAPGGAILKIPP